MKSVILTCVATLTGLAGSCAAEGFEAEETAEAIVLRHDGVVFLTYHKAEVPPPEEADPIFRRSGFIHPLKTPAGVTVTGIHPPDHYHHIGLWHAWVDCKHDGEAVDFWNLKAGAGRVAYSKTISLKSTDEEAGFVVEQEHIAYKGAEKEPVTVLREVFAVTARFAGEAYEIDYESAQTNVTAHELELPAYRYGGGIAYRAPLHWKNGNSDYLSSQGKTRVDGHTTRSKWIAMFGPAQPGKESSSPASLTILSHPGNHDAPQRMRVWPPDTNDGAIFFNYVPIQEHPWAIKPGDTAKMRYRLVVQDAKPDPKDLSSRWERYSKDAETGKTTEAK